MKTSKLTEDEYIKILKDRDYALSLLKVENAKLHKKITKLEINILSMKNALSAQKRENQNLAVRIKSSGPRIYLPYNEKGPLPTFLKMPNGKIRKIKLL